MLLFLLFCLYLFSPTPTHADEFEDLNNKITEYTKKLDELSRSKDTLANQLNILNSQISLTSLKISQTESSIKKIRLEISDLSLKIGTLDSQLNQLSLIYLEQISHNYKLKKRLGEFSLITAPSFNDYLEQLKYLTIIQKNSQNSLINLETLRSNYEYQKNQKNQKQIELTTLQSKLSDQQKSLSRQQSAKSNLLTVTKNDEKKYQQLLQDAQSQLRLSRSFSDSAGGSSCLNSSPGLGSDGNFYSQRDPSWCRQYMGNSKDTIGDVGCYISSISMAYKKLGYNTTPSLYASDPLNFVLNTAYASSPDPPPGYTYRQVPYNSSSVDQELKAGRYVIVQLRMSGTVSGMHFVVSISGSNGQYQMHDPWYRPDQSFSSRYSLSSIMSLRLFTK